MKALKLSLTVHTALLSGVNCSVSAGSLCLLSGLSLGLVLVVLGSVESSIASPFRNKSGRTGPKGGLPASANVAAYIHRVCMCVSDSSPLHIGAFAQSSVSSLSSSSPLTRSFSASFFILLLTEDFLGQLFPDFLISLPLQSPESSPQSNI